jgi:hypothetical protein|nr:MAG TPA: hypothetical protein [Caudoviricetes sp.]
MAQNTLHSYKEKSLDSINNLGPNDYQGNMFRYSKKGKDLTGYRLMRGVPDFGSLVQFTPYETGYAAFIICQMPEFINKLVSIDPGNYGTLVSTWKQIIEFEFKSFDGLQDISVETMTLGDDLNNINVINKVNMQSASEFTLSYEEKTGTPLTKFARLYLTGIKDPRTQVKTYHGLIHNGVLADGFENEVFSFLFINTDSTMMNVEAAYLIVAAQLNSADTDMYNYTKGDINKRDVQVKFNGFPIQSTEIDNAAQKLIRHLLSSDAGNKQIIVNSMNYNYTGTDKLLRTMKDQGMSEAQTKGIFNTGYKHN